MKILLLTKSNDSGRQADVSLRRLLSGADIETVFANLGDRCPERPSWRCDCLISFLCPWILPSSVLEQAGDTLNFHPGPPEYPGFGCYNFALYDGVAEYGVTCHRMVVPVDSGEIVGVRRFKVGPDTTAGELQRQSHEALISLYTEVVAKLGRGEELPACAEWVRPPTTRADFESLRQIPIDADREEVLRRVRAFAHPDHEGAFIELHGERFVVPY